MGYNYLLLSQQHQLLQPDLEVLVLEIFDRALVLVPLLDALRLLCQHIVMESVLICEVAQLGLQLVYLLFVVVADAAHVLLYAQDYLF